MKNKFFYAMSLTLGLNFNVYAADLIVAEGGQGGSYPTITEAYDAASNGDRILVYPKTSGVAYAENLTLAKDVDLSCAVAEEKFGLQGTITINAAAVPLNSEIILSGIRIFSGSITYSGATASGVLNVRIVNCKLDAGNIDMRSARTSAYIAGDSIINGYVFLFHGSVLGNYIENSSSNSATLTISSNNALSGDTLNIIGNVIKTANIGAQIQGINFLNTFNYANISNNIIHLRNPSSYHYGISLSAGDNLLGRNKILNNIVYNTGNSLYGIFIIGVSPLYGSNSYVDIHNNIIASSGSYAIYSYYSSVLIDASYNYINTGITGVANIVNNGTNPVGNMISFLNTTTWNQNAGSPAIDGGNPDAAHTDLDLSPNDAGVFGGSFSFENFYNGGATSVGVVLAPRRVLSGQTISIEASGFDR